MGQRHRSREFALQLLFQVDLTGRPIDEAMPQFWSEREESDDVREFCESLVRGVLERKADIDETITASAQNWRLERMAIVDRNVIRLAILEMAHLEGTPFAIVIDEAVDLAKRFGGPESGAFVNGLLDNVRKRLEGQAGASTS